MTCWEICLYYGHMEILRGKDQVEGVCVFSLGFEHRTLLVFGKVYYVTYTTLIIKTNICSIYSLNYFSLLARIHSFREVEMTVKHIRHKWVLKC